MARVTPKMGLRVWDQLSDLYDNTQQADNWARVDYHDHTPGRGVQIPSDGIEDGAIRIIHLSTEIAAQALLPPGIIIPYGGIGPLQDSSVVPPPGYLFCDGSTYDGTLSDYLKLYAAIGNLYGGTGPSDFHVPNLTEKFPLGASSAYALGARGGSLVHTHIVPNHSHTGSTSGSISVGGTASVSVTVSSGGTTNGQSANPADGTPQSYHQHTTGYTGPGEGFFGSAIGHTGSKDGDVVIGSPGAGQSSTPYKIHPKTDANDHDHVHDFGSSGSGSGSGSISGSTSGSLSVAVGSGTNPSGGTLASGNNSVEAPYVVVNYLIKL